MKFLFIIILAAGGYYYFVQKPKSDAYKEYTSSSVSASKSSKGKEVVYTSVEDMENSYKGLSKSDTISTAIKQVRILHTDINNKLSASKDNSGLTVKRDVDTFVKNYVTILGKAYTVAGGQDKTALKAIKMFAVSWYQRVSYNHQQILKYTHILEHDTKGNLEQIQSSNHYALIELSKVIKQDITYLDSFNTNIKDSRNKYSISNSEIRSYFDELVADVDRVTSSRIVLNKSLNILIDKVYAFNSWILRNSNNGSISLNRGKYAALVRIADEISIAEKDFNRKWDSYQASYK